MSFRSFIKHPPNPYEIEPFFLAIHFQLSTDIDFNHSELKRTEFLLHQLYVHFPCGVHPLGLIFFTVAQCDGDLLEFFYVIVFKANI